ncbi:MAG: GNAT family N-acetyltransferase [Ruegeria sp.]
MPIAVRLMRQEDVPVACNILNQIIAIGGTTAIETPLSDLSFAQSFLDVPGTFCCHVALDQVGEVAGFQWLGSNTALPDGCGDIATFTRRDPILKGAGRALFAETAKAAKKLGMHSINATIRADNHLGLSYYTKMGFKDHSVERGLPLQDGTPVDRISKRIALP